MEAVRPPSPGILAPPPSSTPPAAGSPGVQQLVRAFKLTGNNLVDTQSLQAVLAPWTERQLGLNDIRQAANAVEQYYRAQGWLAVVRLPSQDITDGNVLLRVTEARTGNILLQQTAPDGATVPQPLVERIQSILDHHMQHGEALSLTQLERALALADALPGASVRGTLQASELPGSTDILVQVSPTHSTETYVSADNAGNRATGSARLSTQLTLNSPLGAGDQFRLGASFSQGSQYLYGQASAPLGAQGLRAVVDASVLRYKVLERVNTTTGLPPKGDSRTFGASLQYPLVLTPLANWQVSGGYTNQHLCNEDDNQTSGQRETTSCSNTQALIVGLGGSQLDQWAGGGNTAASISLGVGRLNLNGSPEDYVLGDNATQATQGSYQKMRWNLSRLQSVGPATALYLAGSGQWANTNLDSSEKLYLGGLYGVRAYPNGEAGGSTGQIYTIELRQQVAPQWQLAAFYDWGQVSQYRNNQRADGNPGSLAERNRVTLQGTGLSLGWHGFKGLEIKFTWARRLGSNPLMTPQGTDTDGSLHRNRFWLTTSIVF